MRRCDRLQPGLYLLAARLEKGREREPLAQVFRVLVGGESGPVCGDLEEYPAGLAEVDRAEIVAVDLGRNPEPRGPYPLPPSRVLLVVGRPEGDVVDATPSQMSRPRPRPLDDQHLGSRPARTDLEDDEALAVACVLPDHPEAEHLGEHPRSRLKIPHRELHRAQPPDARLTRHRTTLPRDAASDPVVVAVVHQPEPLPFWVGEGDKAPPATLLDAAIMRHAEPREPLRPKVERVPPRDPKLHRRDLTRARVVRGHPQVRPVEERNLRPRAPELVPV